jgi:hypothetical protein
MGFMQMDGRPSFVISLAWDRHIVVDVESGEEIRPTSEMLRLLQAQVEAKRSKALLEARFDSPLANVEDIELLVETDSRVSLRWLRALEKDTRSVQVEVGTVSAIAYPFRQLARLGLRRFGQLTEIGYPPLTIARPAALGGTPRVFGAEHLACGMSMAEVLQIAGAPECIESNRWRYDVDRDPAFSVDVAWDLEARVATVTRLRPRWETHWPDPQVMADCRRILGAVA